MLILGIEGGGTRTSAALLDESGHVQARAEAGGCNAKLLSDAQMAAVFRAIQKRICQRPDAVSLCLAGVITPADHKRLRAVASSIWPQASCTTGNDRQSALMAGFGRLEGIVAICGTGSSTFGMRDGKLAKCGGWGHLLGDRGSGYDIALRGLRAAVRDWDRTGRLGRLGRLFLQSLNCNAPEELVDWIQHAMKSDIAAAAPVVFRAAQSGDPVARCVLREAAEELADSVRVVATKLRWKSPSVCLSGGVFANQPALFASVRKRLRQLVPLATVRPPRYGGAVGAALLARPEAGPQASAQPNPASEAPAVLEHMVAALTEQRNPRTLSIHKKKAAQLFDLLLDEESRTIPAIRKQKRRIVQCAEAVTTAFRRGGRLFYVGAGTSGRLGVLDAAECPPTFSAPPGMVQGIIAGGMRALYASAEEAEDDPEAGATAVRHAGVTRRDVVVGIAASGRTPFVLGAAQEAARIGAKCFLLTFNPATRLPRAASKVRIIAVATGPEAITGSTRLKAGTATKLILNMLTTISMIRLGKVVSNLMVDLRPTNQKLRDRACRIVMTLKGCSYQEAWGRLRYAQWNVKKAAQGR